MNISVIGAGTMGNGIAHVFAQNNFKVNLIDVSQDALDRALKIIESNLERQVQKGSIDANTKKSTLDNISTYTNIPGGVINADFVVEAATENEALKLKIFQQIDEVAPANAILASNTSSISITKIASATKRPEKVIGMHFMNPVPIMKLVEVIKGYATDKEVTKFTMDLATKLGKIPVEVRDYPGFVANRILMPLINESIFTLGDRIAGVQAIDTVMRLGVSHPMGPLQLADFIGLDVCLAILRVLHDGFGDPKYAPSPLLINMVTAGYTGKKSGEGFYDYSNKDSKELVVSKMFLDY